MKIKIKRKKEKYLIFFYFSLLVEKKTVRLSTYMGELEKSRGVLAPKL